MTNTIAPFVILFFAMFAIVRFAQRRREREHEEEKRDLVAAFDRRYASLKEECAMQKAHAARHLLERVIWRESATFLWKLLDDIDTLDDSCRNNHMRFRERVRAAQQQRTRVATSDGYVLTWTHGREK